ncbi:MAG: hypothetical protein ABJH52_08535 [Henriciella sp.]
MGNYTLVQALDRIVESNFSSVASELTSTIKLPPDPPSLVGVVQKLIEQDCYVPDDTYVHDNGYLKLTLATSDKSGAKLRIHLWPADTKKGNIHSHRWNLHSHVLFGRIRNQVFTEDSGGETYNAYEYSPDPELELYRLKELGQTQLVNTQDYELAVGTNYQLQRNVLHRTQAARSAPAATLMITFDAHPLNFTKVFSESKLIATGSVEVKRSSKPQLFSFLEQFYELVR